MLSDLRHGIRMLRKQPGSSASAIIALALGIGLTTLMFSIVYGVVVRGLPFEKPHQIVHIASTNVTRNIEDMGVTVHDLADMRASQHSFTNLGGTRATSVNISNGEKPERMDAAWVTPDVFDILRAKPEIGRTFQPADAVDGTPDVVIIDHATWANRFGGRADAIGSTLRINGHPTTIVGVMPARFGFPQSQHLWLPLYIDPTRVARGQGEQLDVVGRLRDGVSIEAANADVASIARRIAAMYPESNKGIGAAVVPYVQAQLGREPIALLFTMLGAVFMVLVVACTNVANLLIARSAMRSREVGIRTALGASRFRVVRQFMAETLLISILGAVLGLGIAAAGANLFTGAIASTNPPFWIDVRLDRMVMLFVVAITCLSTLVAGVFPALNATRIALSEVLKDESRGGTSRTLARLTRGLVVLEIAMSAGLLVAAGLMIRSVTELRSIEFDFQTTNIFNARVTLPRETYATQEQRDRFFDDLLTRIRAIPDVEDVALGNAVPGRGSFPASFQIEGVNDADTRAHPQAGTGIITPTLFATLGVKPVAGRTFSPQDRRGSLPVAIVTRELARRYFGTASPIGKRIRIDGPTPDEFRTIIGVVPDLYIRGLSAKDQSAIYIPAAQAETNSMDILARVKGSPTAITSDVRTAVASIDPDQPIAQVTSLAQAIDKGNWFYRVFGSLFVAFGCAALFLASFGLYGVMATSVNHRTREMGVRMALGADTRDILRLVLNEGMVKLAIGLALGLAFALFLSRLLTALLFNVKPRDPVTYAAITIVLVVTALVATLIPAGRAARVDPTQAMRAD
jgi:predicted permease